MIRNERKYHLYSFDDGKRFEPDYILILGNKSTVVEQQQIFIEPKGQHLIDNDIWKEHLQAQQTGSRINTGFPLFSPHSNSTKPNQFCLEIILCRIRGAFEYLMYPYYPAYMG